jgi:hypothetical protein
MGEAAVKDEGAVTDNPDLAEESEEEQTSLSSEAFVEGWIDDAPVEV